MPLQQLLPIHIPDSLLSFLKIPVLNQGIPLGIASFSIQIEMQTLDFPKFRKSIKNIVLLDLLVKIGNYKYPPLNS